jgi:hypothetical protein
LGHLSLGREESNWRMENKYKSVNPIYLMCWSQSWSQYLFTLQGFFCSTEVWTQCVTLARQALYHLSHSTSPKWDFFFFSVFVLLTTKFKIHIFSLFVCFYLFFNFYIFSLKVVEV